MIISRKTRGWNTVPTRLRQFFVTRSPDISPVRDRIKRGEQSLRTTVSECNNGVPRANVMVKARDCYVPRVNTYREIFVVIDPYNNEWIIAVYLRVPTYNNNFDRNNKRNVTARIRYTARVFLPISVDRRIDERSDCGARVRVAVVFAVVAAPQIKRVRIDGVARGAPCDNTRC